MVYAENPCCVEKKYQIGHIVNLDRFRRGNPNFSLCGSD